MQNIEQSRIQLSQAARRLVDAARGDIGAADVAAAAALPLASIAQAYGDFDTLLCELLGQMYDETRDLIARMTLNMPAGRSRLQVAIDAYLQGFLERPGQIGIASCRETVCQDGYDSVGAVSFKKQKSSLKSILVLK